jgi:hypothetical protein
MRPVSPVLYTDDLAHAAGPQLSSPYQAGRYTARFVAPITEQILVRTPIRVKPLTFGCSSVAMVLGVER